MAKRSLLLLTLGLAVLLTLTLQTVLGVLGTCHSYFPLLAAFPLMRFHDEPPSVE